MANVGWREREKIRRLAQKMSLPQAIELLQFCANAEYEIQRGKTVAQVADVPMHTSTPADIESMRDTVSDTQVKQGDSADMALLRSCLKVIIDTATASPCVSAIPAAQEALKIVTAAYKACGGNDASTSD